MKVDLRPPTLISALLVLAFLADLGACLNRYVNSYETLNYRPLQSERRKRSLDDADGGRIDLRFRSHNRTFNLKLHPIDPHTNVFSHEHIVDVDGEFVSDQLRPRDFLYEGHLKDDPASRVYGSIIDGVFDGHIFLSDGKSFSVEKAGRYFDVDKRPSHFHSIIYRDDEINHEKFRVKRNANSGGDENPSSCGITKEVQARMRKIQDSAEVSPFLDDAKSYSYLDAKSHFLQDADDFAFPYRYMNRSKRDLGYRNGVKEVNGRRLHGVRTCTMYLQADQKLYEAIYFKEGNKNHIRTREEIVSLFYNHIKAVNQIYESTDFGGVQGLNFVIQRTSIYTRDTCLHGKPVPGSDNPFCEENVDVSNFLNLNSERNHSAFCLAYALTFRDFVGGTLGLAWVASPTFSTAGGICQVYQKYNEGQQGTAYRSLNTGIITLVNYAHRVPLRVSQLTMAHEIGHNFGAPHDQTAECQPGLPDGNFIMFASATSGDKVNNAKFSRCSVASISQVLYEVLQQTPVDAHQSLLPVFGKKRNCFQERTSAFCGNQIREPGEQCDCGFSKRDCEEMGDSCCQPRESHSGPCNRTPGMRCSPSEGLCCKASACDFYTADENQVCREESECLYSQQCDGRGAACPESRPKMDGQPCQDVTKVCHAGSCNGSICAEVGLKDCFLTKGKPTQLCHLACEKNGTCLSSFELPEFEAGRFHQMDRKDKPGLLLHPGSPCNNYKGYCDIFRKCRSVDSNGPLARLKNLFFNKHTIKTVSQWVQEHWWACVFIGIGILLFMALFVKCCAVHTPSTNPNKLPAQHFSDTLRHPGTLLRRGRPHPHGAYTVAVNGNQPTQMNAVPSSSNAAPRSNRHQRQMVAAQRQSNHYSSRHSASAAANGNNRVPANMSAPPLIPPQQAQVVAVPPAPANVIHEPPPPYSLTDPVTALSPSASSPPSQTASTSASTANTAQMPATIQLISSTSGPVPKPASLPGAPLPSPVMPGPPYGQGPKPGRRKPKTPQQQSDSKKKGNVGGTPNKRAAK